MFFIKYLAVTKLVFYKGGLLNSPFMCQSRCLLTSDLEDANSSL